MNLFSRTHFNRDRMPGCCHMTWIIPFKKLNEKKRISFPSTYSHRRYIEIFHSSYLTLHQSFYFDFNFYSSKSSQTSSPFENCFLTICNIIRWSTADSRTGKGSLQCAPISHATISRRPPIYPTALKRGRCRLALIIPRNSLKLISIDYFDRYFIGCAFSFDNFTWYWIVVSCIYNNGFSKRVFRLSTLPFKLLFSSMPSVNGKLLADNR